MKETTGDKIFNVINTIFMIIILLVILYPLIFILSASISDPLYVNQGKVILLPKGITFEGFERVFANSEIWTGYRNTIFYTAAGTCINLFVTLTCAYSLSRKDFYGRNFLTAFFSFTMFFGGGLIPTYLLVQKLGMINKVWALLIPNAASMMNIIIARTYFQTSIPYELQEAAFIDGCSNMKIFTRIILPLSKPIVAVIALYYGVGHWNAFFSAFIYLNDRKLFPLQLIMREILIESQMSAQMMTSSGDLEALAQQAKIADLIKYAIMIVSTLPVLIVYPFLQKYFTKGMMLGAIKG